MFKKLFIIVLSLFLLVACSDKPWDEMDINERADKLSKMTITEKEKYIYSIPGVSYRDMQDIYPAFKHDKDRDELGKINPNFIPSTNHNFYYDGEMRY